MMSSKLARACKAALCISVILGSSQLAVGVGNSEGGLEDRDGNYDARFALIDQSNLQSQALAPAMSGRAVVANIQEMVVEANDITGAVGSMSNAMGFLTDARPGEPMAIAMDFVRANLTALGLEAADLEGMRVRNVVRTKQNGATHIYLQQVLNGIDVYNGQLQINVSRDGRIMNIGNSFMPTLARSMGSMTPRLPLNTAVEEAMKFAGTKIAARPRVLGASQGVQQVTRVSGEGISLDGPITGKLMILPIRPGEAKLVWNFQMTGSDKNMWDITVDADTGQTWSRTTWTSNDAYRVYPFNVASPNHTSPLPPSDGRILANNPANAAASPFGWHDTNGAAGAESTLTQGNNVQAYTDVDANNAPDANSSPNGGANLVFDFPLPLTQAPSAYRPAAVANLFYLNNIMHDIQYQYGFDEAGGNFQMNNYGRGGVGNDSVRAEAQDGSGTNNANFSTPPDGQRPRMQMFTWTAPTPDRDGDIDATIVFHEYGHGISTRLVGGPANSSCLGSAQQPGEGLSDWWALVYTGQPGDRGTDGRGVGTYSLGQPNTGLGVRTQRYSTDPAINNFTYQSISGLARPHGVGSVFAQAAWEMYWKLVDKYGFDPNLANANGTAGNQRAMFIVNEGLKNTPCNPSMLQVRDGYLAAAASVRNGEDVCLVWAGFAGVGMGVNAVSGGANSLNPTNGFNVPAMCQGGGGGGGATVIFQDDFETNRGWVTNASGTDTATTGRWERGDPEATNSTGPKQLGTTTSGVNNLVTARLAGAAAGTNDVDGGLTSITSPAIALPATGNLTLSFNYYLAHGSNATNADFFRVSIVGNTTAVVFQKLGAAADVDAVFTGATANLSAFAGQTVRILVQTTDAATASLLEAAVDDVRITQQQ
jgi:extracellular elastinolytic metalloproteinase